MKRSIKAVLLSGLVFPGLGQLVCGRQKLGAVLVLTASAGLLLLVLALASQTETILQSLQPSMESGTGDPAAVMAAVTGTGGILSGLGSFLVLGAWVAGVGHALTLRD